MPALYSIKFQLQYTTCWAERMLFFFSSIKTFRTREVCIVFEIRLQIVEFLIEMQNIFFSLIGFGTLKTTKKN